jgi:hypothetical protein
LDQKAGNEKEVSSDAIFLSHVGGSTRVQ